MKRLLRGFGKRYFTLASIQAYASALVMHKGVSKTEAKAFTPRLYKKDEAPPLDESSGEIATLFALLLLVVPTTRKSEYLHKLKSSRPPP